jgi:hypothetical protein
VRGVELRVLQLRFECSTDGTVRIEEENLQVQRGVERC